MLIEFDSYDLAAFERACAQHAHLREAIQSGAQLMPGFQELARDVFCLLYKYNVIRVDDAAAKPDATPRASMQLASRLLGWVMSAPAYERLKAETTLDELRAGHATTAMTRRVLAILKNEALFSSEELLESFELDALERREEETREALELTESLLESDEERSETSEDALEATRSELVDELFDIRRDLRQLAEDQAQRIEQLPASVESDVRALVDSLPERMEDGAEAVEAFGVAMGGNFGADTSAAEKLELGERLLTNEKLRKLAALVGAFRQYALGARRSHVERRPSELHAVSLGAEIGRLLPSELSQLRHPLRRRDVLRRLLDGQLLQYDIRGRDRAGKGPMVVCLDGSHSMLGARELWAKAVCLTLVELCRRRKRAFRAITFSGHVRDLRSFSLLEEATAQSLRAPRIDMTALLDFADYFPRGGTRFEEPLDRAIQALSESRLKGGDIVLITDGESHVSAAWRERFLECKRALEFRLYVVLVDISGFRDEGLRDLADHITSVRELTAEDARDLFRIA